VQHNLLFESDLQRCAEQLAYSSHYQVKINSLELERLEATLHWGSRERLQNAARTLEQWAEQLPLLTARLFRSRQQQLTQLDALCQAMHPENVLRRGYSLTLKNGKTLTSTTDIQAGDELETRLREGVLRSTVIGKGAVDKS